MNAPTKTVTDSVTQPDLARPDAGIAMISTWSVGTPERQRAAVEAIATAWGQRAWPTGDLLSYNVYAGDDGDTLLHYSQWTSEEAYREFARTQRQGRVDEIDAAVPGVVRLGLAPYRLYRSRLAEGETRTAGSIVIVDVEFDGPDEQRQRDWVDAVFAALGSDAVLPPGGIAAHFHLSVDGTRILNYAEWESAQAHIDALATPGAGIGSPTLEWARVQHFPGVTDGGGVNRYRFARSITPR